MKKLVSILLTLMLTVSLAACGGSTGTPSSAAPADGGTSSTGGGESSGGGAEGALNVWCWDPAFNIYAMEVAAEIYKKDHPDFEIQISEVPWNDLQPRLTTAATSGQLDTLPDISLMQDNAFQKNAINYPDLFVDLTDTAIDFSQFASAKVAYSVIDGRNYGVPFDNGTVINALRTDILEQAGYGIDDFKDITWERYIEIGEDILSKTGNPIMSVVAGESDLPMIMLQSAGSSLFTADGQPNFVDNAELKEIANLYKELIDKGVCTLTNNWDEYVSTFTTGGVAGTLNGCWILASIQTATDQSGNWALTNIPKMTTPGATNYSNNGGSSWGVFSSSQSQELAIDFLNSTFAGSVELYETILPSSGAMATYLPAGQSDVYGVPQEFFGGQAIYADITEYASHVPSTTTGVYYYEARDALATALTNIVNGGDIDNELQGAQDTVAFQMG